MARLSLSLLFCRLCCCQRRHHPPRPTQSWQQSSSQHQSHLECTSAPLERRCYYSTALISLSLPPRLATIKACEGALDAFELTLLSRFAQPQLQHPPQPPTAAVDLQHGLTVADGAGFLHGDVRFPHRLIATDGFGLHHCFTTRVTIVRGVCADSSSKRCKGMGGSRRGGVYLPRLSRS